MPPKKGAPPPAEVQETPETLPEDVPETCPFEVDWQACCFTVSLADGLDEMPLKEALVAARKCKAVHVAVEAAAVEAQTTDSELKQAVLAGKPAPAAAEGYLPAPPLAAALLQARFDADREQAWKVEWARRRDAALDSTAVDTARARTAAAKEALDKAADAMLRLERRLSAEQAGLPTTASMVPPEQDDESEAPEDASECAEDQAAGSHIAATDPRFVPHTRLLRARRQLEAAERQEAAADAAAEALSAAQLSRFVHSQPYWLKGIPGTLDGHLAALEAGVPLAGLVHAHAPADADGSAPELPELMQDVDAASAGAAWDAPAGSLASVVIAVGPHGGPFADKALYAPPEEATATAAPAAKKGAKGAPAVPAGPLVGAHELTHLFAVLSRCASAHREWSSKRTLHQLAECSLEQGRYKALADSIPVEQQSIPVLLHCMLEQVARNVEGSGTEETQVVALQSAASAFAAAFDALAGASDSFQDGHLGPEDYAYTTVLEGDSSAMARHGLYSGAVQPALRAEALAVVSADASDAGEPEAHPLAPAVDVGAVEAHMASLLEVKGGAADSLGDSADHADVLTAALMDRDMLAAQAQQAGVSTEALDRFMLLQKAASLLTPGAHSAHSDEVLARYHLEELPPHQMKQTISCCALRYPDVATAELPVDGAHLIVCHGGTVQQSHASTLPCNVPFSKLVAETLASAPACTAVDLPLVVYTLTAAQAAVCNTVLYGYPSDGSVVSASEEGGFHVSHEGLHVAFHPGDLNLLSVTCDGGVTLSTQRQRKLPAVDTTGAGPADGEPTDTPEESQPDDSEARSAEAAETEDTADTVKPEALRLKVTTPAGVSIESDTSGMLLIRQAPRPALTLEMTGASVHGAPLSDANCNIAAQDGQEAWRAVLLDCTVVTCSRAGTLQVLLPDGSLQRRTADSSLQDADGTCIAAWVATAVDGVRVKLADRLPVANVSESPEAPADDAEAASDQVEASLEPCLLNPARCSRCTDPDSGAVVTTRDDMTMHIQYTTGDQLLQYPDGSRLTRWADESWTLQTEGLPCVYGSPLGWRISASVDLTLRWDSASLALTFDYAHVCSGAVLGSLICLGAGLDTVALCDVLDAASEVNGEGLLQRAQNCSLAPECSAALVIDMDIGTCCVRDAAASQPEVSGPLSLGISADGVRYGFMPPPPPPVQDEPSADAEAHAGEEGAPGERQSASAQPGAAAAAGSKRATLEQQASIRSAGSVSAGSGEPTENDPDALSSEASAAAPAPPADPTAPALAPRVFVLFPDGHGHELLSAQTYSAYAARTAGQRWTTEVLDDAPDGHSRLHRFVTQHDPCDTGVPPLPTAAPHRVCAPDTEGFLDLLRRPSRVYPAPSTGLALPRIAACHPTKPIQQALPPVLTVREFRVLSKLGPGLQTACEGIIAAHTQQMDDLAAHRVSEHTVADQRDAEEQAVHLTLLAQLREMQGVDARAAAAVAERERADRSAAAAAAADEADERDRAAAAQAAAIKPYRVWQPEIGEYAHCPQAPCAGSILRYFDAEDGLRALQTDPLLSSGTPVTRNTLPSRPPNQPSATAFETHGVYRTPKPMAEASGLSVPSRSELSSAGSARGDALPGIPSPCRSEQPPGQMLAHEFSNESGADYSAQGAEHLDQVESIARHSAKLPNLYRKSKARVELNDAYLMREFPAMKMSSTSSAALVQLRGKDGLQFTLSPDRLDFGDVRTGDVVQRALTLHNVSLERTRYAVQQVAPPLRVAYKPGAVAAGLTVRITVEFTGLAIGDFCADVVVKSEVNVLTVPVTARVLLAAPPAVGQHTGDVSREESSNAPALTPEQEEEQAVREVVDRALAPVVLDETCIPEHMQASE